MLAYEDALGEILRVTPPPPREVRPLDRAAGLVLAAPLAARLDLPRFDNSAVDGYALAAPSAVGEGAPLRVIGAARAGRPFRGAVRPGEAVRILTGAPIPRGTQAVVMQERAIRRGDTLRVEAWPSAGANIRRRGEDVEAGQPLLSAGTVLRAQALALLAAAGHRAVPVLRPPAVAILVTGDELRRPGARLGAGQIHDSNGLMLAALARSHGAAVRRLGIARDDKAALIRRMRRGLAADVLLIAGGVSVGDTDFVREAARHCGVRPIFWQVDIKPGKPLFFGRRGRTVVFGLPGNPVSVFATFQEFVVPSLRRLMGRPWEPGYRVPATLATELRLSTSRRTHFVRVHATGRNGSLRVAPVHGQGSHQLLGLVRAEGWLRLASEDGPWPAGARVLLKPEALG
jgi:molybdopterin molybdotransferase